jgi:hypothetical protein
MSLNFRSKKFIKDNIIQDVDKFLKELKVTLRLDYDVPTKEIYKMNPNQLIEKYLEFREKEEIGGA